MAAAVGRGVMAPAAPRPEMALKLAMIVAAVSVGCDARV